MVFPNHVIHVSISQSRCLSFQVTDFDEVAHKARVEFQSRNRDAYHFRRASAGSSRHIYGVVSISQSRCLSFQVATACGLGKSLLSVSISQSRCLSFQVAVGVNWNLGLYCFNLAIEMLIISGHVLASALRRARR